MTLAVWLSFPLAICGLVVPWAMILPSHAFDKSWPAHARFHATWGAAKLFALGVTQLMIIIFPFSRGERWSWFALATIVLFGGVSIYPASRLQHGPVVPFSHHDRSTRLIVLCLLAGMLGLGLSVYPMFFAW